MSLPLKLAFAEIRKLEGEKGKDLWLWYCPEGASGEPLLLLAKKPIPVSEINEARKGAKSNKSCKGRILLDDKTLKVRVVGAAPSNLEKALRKIAADNGMRGIGVQLVENQPDEEAAALGQATTASASDADDGDGAPAATQDDLSAALLRAKPQIEQVKAHPQKRLQLADIMSDINDKAERGRYGEAVKRVGDVVALAALSDTKLGEHRKKVADGAVASPLQIKGWKDEEQQWRDAARLDTYQVGNKVGSGGMGAINLMNSSEPGAPALVFKTGAGLDHEAAIYAKVGPHPNIARSLGMQKVGGSSGLVLEAVTGGDMSQALEDMSKMREAGTLKEEEFWGVLQFSMKRSLEALAFMQQQGVTHRDIKPANIMYDEATGEPKLVDMGIATDGKAAKGFTFGYVPGHDNETADKNDPFAVGATLFEVGHGNTGGKSGAGKGFKYGKEQTSPGWKATMDIGEYHADDQNRAMKVSDQASDVSTTDASGKRTKKEGMYGASTAYTEFVNWLMHPDPAQRPDPATALDHPFMQQAMLGDDEARASVKKIIQARKAPDLAATVPGPTAQQARTHLAQVIRSDLPKQIDAATKRVEQATKLAAALQAKVDKSGKKATVQAEELGRYEALLGEFKTTADTLRTERAKWADAGQALTAATASAANDPTQAKQLASDQKLLQAVTATTRKAQDALTALERATLTVSRALGKADDVAQDAWTATDLSLSAKTWAAMKKGAIQHGLKDEATGVGAAFEVCDKLAAEFAKKKQPKVHAGLLLALGKLRGKVAAMKPVTTWGGPHPGMVAYRDALVQGIDAEVGRLRAAGAGG